MDLSSVWLRTAHLIPYKLGVPVPDTSDNNVNHNEMTSYDLAEIIASTPRSSPAILRKSGSGDDGRRSKSSFDERLQDKLLLPRPSSSSLVDENNIQQSDGDDDSSNATNTISISSDSTTFDTVRTLFRTAAKALECELRHHHQQQHLQSGCTTTSSSTSSKNHDTDTTETLLNICIKANCHWIPGRIEVMGKHTDYAGGNSLVCATTGRGMAMVSTFIDGEDKVAVDDEIDVVANDAINGNSNGDGPNRSMNVTIVSVLPPGMQHHANNKTTTIAPYQVEGRTVVHHTIHISDNHQVVEENDEDCDEPTRATDWTIYPTAVIERLHHNFGLIRYGGSGEGGGGHLFIAISSKLPPASGLSTSSALVTGLFLAVNSHMHLSTSDRFRTAIGDDGDKNNMYNLSTYLGNVENGRDYINKGVVLEGTEQGGVGTFGGSEDHAAILLGKIGELRLLSFCPTRPASIDMMPVSSDTVDENQADEDVSLYPIADKIDSVILLPADVTFVIAYSGVKAEKAGGVDGDSAASMGYNSASDLARCTLNAYLVGGGGSDSSEQSDDIQTLADAIRWECKHVPSASFSNIRCEMMRRIKSGAMTMMVGANSSDGGDSKSLVQRFVHFYNESEYFVPAAAFALSRKKYDLLGAVVDSSHCGAVNLLRNQTEETAWLPLWARCKEHALQLSPLLVVDMQDVADHLTNNSRRIIALASSAFGAGYGGSCWALVYRHEAHEFARQWQTAFEERFPPTKQINEVVREFFVADPGPGAFRV